VNHHLLPAQRAWGVFELRLYTGNLFGGSKMAKVRVLVTALVVGAALLPGLASATTSNGQKGYEGQPGNQGNGQQGYEGQPGNQGN